MHRECKCELATDVRRPPVGVIHCCRYEMECPRSSSPHHTIDRNHDLNLGHMGA